MVIDRGGLQRAVGDLVERAHGVEGPRVDGGVVGTGAHEGVERGARSRVEAAIDSSKPPPRGERGAKYGGGEPSEYTNSRTRTRSPRCTVALSVKRDACFSFEPAVQGDAVSAGDDVGVAERGRPAALQRIERSVIGLDAELVRARHDACGQAVRGPVGPRGGGGEAVSVERDGDVEAVVRAEALGVGGERLQGVGGLVGGARRAAVAGAQAEERGGDRAAEGAPSSMEAAASRRAAP